MLRKMEAEEVHRVYVLDYSYDGARKPIGVISFTDVLKHLALLV